MSDSSTEKNTNAAAGDDSASLTAIPKKVFIRQSQKAPSGPFHWKLVVEWYELGLIDAFSFDTGGGDDRPVADLVEATGIPPTIGMHSIFLAPSDGAAKCSKDLLADLQHLGFPETDHTVNQEQAEHILKRLKLSDEALDAEDPKFIVKCDIIPSFEPESEAPKPSTVTENDDVETPVAMESVPEVDTAPEIDAEPVSEPEVDTIAEASRLEPSVDTPPVEERPLAAKEPETSAPKFPDSINELLQGDLVAEGDSDDDEDEPYAIKKSHSGMLIALAAVLLVVGGGVVAYMVSSGGEEIATVEISPVVVDPTSEVPDAEIQSETESLVDEDTESAPVVDVAPETEVALPPEPTSTRTTPTSESVEISELAPENVMVEEEVVQTTSVDSAETAIESIVVNGPNDPDFSDESVEPLEPTLSEKAEESVMADTSEIVDAPIPQVDSDFDAAAVESPTVEPVETSDGVSLNELPATTSTLEGEATPSADSAVEPSDQKADAKETETRSDAPVEKFPDYIPSF